jgi:hypothetical protein
MIFAALQHNFLRRTQKLNPNARPGGEADVEDERYA